MSDHDFNDEDPDLTTVEQECEGCGATFGSEGRWQRVPDLEGHRRPSEWHGERRCPACADLGADPPRCLSCSAPLSGKRSTGIAHSDEDPYYECGGCDAQFSVADMRALLLGREIEREERMMRTRIRSTRSARAGGSNPPTGATIAHVTAHPAPGSPGPSNGGAGESLSLPEVRQ